MPNAFVYIWGMVFEAVEHSGAVRCETVCAKSRRGESMRKSMNDVSVMNDMSVMNDVLSRLGPLCETVDVGALLHEPLPCPAVVVLRATFLRC